MTLSLAVHPSHRTSSAARVRGDPSRVPPLAVGSIFKGTDSTWSESVRPYLIPSRKFYPCNVTYDMPWPDLPAGKQGYKERSSIISACLFFVELTFQLTFGVDRSQSESGRSKSLKKSLPDDQHRGKSKQTVTRTRLGKTRQTMVISVPKWLQGPSSEIVRPKYR